MRRAPIVGILAIAALARFWAIDFCLPSTLCRPDEEAVAAISTYFFTRNFNPHFFDWPSFFMYEVSVALIPLFKVGLWLGWYRGEKHFVEMMRLDPAPVFLTARLLSAIAGVATVWVVYRIGKILPGTGNREPGTNSGETVGLIAALFLALAFLHARDSHFGVTDITATLLVAISFLFTIRKDVVWAAVFAGLATATKYNSVLICLPLLISVIKSPRRIAIVAGVMFAAFFVASPFVVIDYTNALKAFDQISDHLRGGHGVALGRGWSYQLSTSLRYGLGLPLLIAGIAGLAVAAVRSPRQGLLMAVFPITYYLSIGAGYTVFARYILPVVPFLCLTAAIGVDEIASWRGLPSTSLRPGKPSPSIPAFAIPWRATAAFGFAQAALAVAIILPSAWSIIQFDALLARTDSRVMVEDWVQQRFPDGAVIGQMLRMSNRLSFVPEVLGQPSKYQLMLVDEVQGEPGSRGRAFIALRSRLSAAAVAGSVDAAISKRVLGECV